VPEAAILAGKQVVFAEHGAFSYNQNPEDLMPHLSSNRIYVATHQYGIGAPIEKLMDACRSADVVVYEDIAAALGTRINGRPAGTFGDACFGSFDTTKLVNAPLKGGFLATANPDIFRRAEQVAERELSPMSLMRKAMVLGSAFVLVSLRASILYKLFHTLNFTWRGRATAETGKLESQPTEIYLNKFADWQANVVLPQLARFDDTIRSRQLNYRRLRTLLQHVQKFTLPPDDVDSEWAPIRFPIFCHVDKMNYYKQGTKRGVDFGFSFTKIAAPAEHLAAHTIAAGVLNLPFDASLSSVEIDRIVAMITELEIA
jgi:dTDP-4-amino-4,6-dideoxygalactose transaminase